MKRRRESCREANSGKTAATAATICCSGYGKRLTAKTPRSPRKKRRQESKKREERSSSPLVTTGRGIASSAFFLFRYLLFFLGDLGVLAIHWGFHLDRAGVCR